MVKIPTLIVDSLAPADNATAHCNIGAALKAKGDLDGAIAEYRAALRLQPDKALAHYDLGRVLWTKGDREAAFEEFRTAYNLAPNEPTIRQVYYDLMRQMECSRPESKVRQFNQAA
jgi:Flp pilus assembly protein TadD